LLQSDRAALENTTLVADSLHTNATNAHLIVSVNWPRNNWQIPPPFFESRACQWLLNAAPDSGGTYRSRRSCLSPRSSTHQRRTRSYPQGLGQG
jgi:hypothetical protein